MSDSITSIETLIHQGRFLEARIKSEQLILTNNDLRVKQLHALALSKSGIPRAAAEFFEPVYHQYPEDAETAGILGGIYKDLFRGTQDQKYALLSRDTYLKNFEKTQNYYTGINAATMSAIAGKFQKGREVAKQVLTVLPKTPVDFWELVTKAEALLLTKDHRTSLELYFKAHQLAGADWGKINTVYSQLWMLNHYMPVPGEILKAFSPPNVAVLVGHMIDHPQRAAPRFPGMMAAQIKTSLIGILKTLNARIGYSSLACGSDTIFAEAMEETGGEINVYLPFKSEDFLDTSVKFAGEEWVQRFLRITDNHSIHYLTRESYLGNDDLFSFLGRVLFGLALLRGRMLHIEPYLITVLSEWDRTLKEGGTRDLMKLWPFPTRVHHIDPSKLLPVSAPPATTMVSPGSKPPSNRMVLYMVGISFDFVPNNELERLAIRIKDEMDQELIALEVDDNLVLAGFNSSLRAPQFCKNLIREIERAGIQTHCKIAFHAGPVQIESVHGEEKMLGTHADMLIGILGKAGEGGTFASEQFAACLVLEDNSCSFIQAGKIDLGPELGLLDVYLVEMNK